MIAGLQIKGRRLEVPPDLEGGDAGGIGLQSQRDQVIHHGQIGDEIRVLRLIDLRVGLGHVRPFTAQLDLLFHIADGREKLIQLFLVPLAQVALQ